MFSGDRIKLPRLGTVKDLIKRDSRLTQIIWDSDHRFSVLLWREEVEISLRVHDSLNLAIIVFRVLWGQVPVKEPTRDPEKFQ